MIMSVACTHVGSMSVGAYFENGSQEDLAMAAGNGQTKEAERLLSSGAIINFQGREGMTALIWALLQQNKKG